MKQTSKTLDINGKVLTLETGVLAEQATGAVLARLGDTMVLSTVVMSQQDTNLDYFPLSVEYVERLYAGGRIKGSKWVKREGRPSDDAILTARLIDRSIRPLFPKELKKDVQVVVTLLSVDGENDPDILSAVATSAALAVSRIPWNGPIGSTRIGVVEQEGAREFVVNPAGSEKDFVSLDIVVSSRNGKAVMIEAEGKQVKEDVVFEAVKHAKEWNEKIISLIQELAGDVGEKKVDVAADEKFEDLQALVEKSYKSDIEKIIDEGSQKESYGELEGVIERIQELEKDTDRKKVKEAVDVVFKKTIRAKIIKDGKRPDGRGETDIRPITARVGVLPRTHGSAIFERGQTQVLTVATLGTSALEQLIESPEGEEAKRYMHHYSFPPYSVGETGRIGAPNRREIGHGALAERALLPVLPPEGKFPYAVRVVSEVMSSNGSTSQASVCGSTLALMDAGVPISAPVAGIAIGLMTDAQKYVLLSDIIGLEDFAGDMDFKVAGTERGITAIQLDVKIDGLTDEMIEQTLARAREGRLTILEKMLSVIPQARTEVSVFAPKIKTITIPTEKIGEVIGSGGKVIRNIIATTGATVDVEDDGTVTISSVDEEAVERAVSWIETLTRELTRGEVFEGTVKRMMSFGAFVELVPGKEGLVHVSEMAPGFVQNPEDVVKIGQKVKVRVKEIDDMGRINLSMLFGADAERKESGQGQRQEFRGESTDRRGGSDRGFSRGGRPRHGGGRSFGVRRGVPRGPRQPGRGGLGGAPRDNFPRR